jgi:hypothetical protein
MVEVRGNGTGRLSGFCLRGTCFGKTGNIMMEEVEVTVEGQGCWPWMWWFAAVEVDGGGWCHSSVPEDLTGGWVGEDH